MGLYLVECLLFSSRVSVRIRFGVCIGWLVIMHTYLISVVIVPHPNRPCIQGLGYIIGRVCNVNISQPMRFLHFSAFIL